MAEDLFDDLRKEIDAEIARLKNSRSKIDTLEVRLRILREQFVSASQLIREYKPNVQATEAISGISNIILLEEGMRAIKETREFDLEIFRWRFRAALENPQSIKLRLSGDTLMVTINLNDTAGTLSDYVDAVEQTRAQLNVGKMNPSWRSWMWQEKYYKPAREGTSVPPRTANRKDATQAYIAAYWNTIAMRVGNFSSLAPFWEIIDKGTLAMNFSGMSGTPYPATGPTHFTQRTINRIKAKFQTALKQSKQFLADLISSITSLQKAIVYVESLLLELGREKEIAAIVVEKRLGEVYSKADQQKLDSLLNKLASGQDIPDRVSLGSVEGKRVRVRTIELRKQIAAFRNR